MHQNVAFSVKKKSILEGRDVPPLDSFGVSICLLKTNPLIAASWIRHWIIQVALKSTSCRFTQ